MKQSVAVKCSALSRRFGSVIAVDSLDLEISSGKIFGLLGKNGSGKSTIIKMLATLIPPSSGSLTIGGFDIVSQPTKARELVGYVRPMLRFDPLWTAEENLTHSENLKLVPRSLRLARVHDVLAIMDMASVAGVLVKTFSVGMTRRLEIAEAILHAPSLLVLDEPGLTLDPVSSKILWHCLRNLNEVRHTTIFVTTHSVDDLEFCDEVAILNAGKILTKGTPEQVKHRLHPEPGALHGH